METFWEWGDVSMCFLVFSDLHYGYTGDGDQRIGEILERARKEKVDFVVSLGDLCDPIPENTHLVQSLRSLGVPFFHTIGNHETDACDLEVCMDFFGLPHPWYSVVWQDYKLIFLNTCYLLEDGQAKPYCRRNYKKGKYVHPVIPQEQIQWLTNELSDGRKYIIFSHHSLVNEFAQRGVQNRAQIRQLFEGKQVLLCLNGHDHGDGYCCVGGIHYVTINSSNYAWVGSQIAGSEELRRKYGYLQGILQYDKAMSACVEIDDREIRIIGQDCRYSSVTPDDIGLHDYRWNGVSVEPRIRTHFLPVNTEKSE